MFREAAGCSTSLMDKLLSAVDCVLLLCELGKYEAAQIKLLEVAEAIRPLDVANVQENDADALLTLAKIFASSHTEISRSLHQSYLELKSRALRLSTAFTDERFYGHQLRLESALASAAGDLQLSYTLNQQAFDIYDRLGIRSQASQIALELARNEGGQHYYEYARREASRWPKSSFAFRVRRVDPQFAAQIAQPRAGKRRKLQNR